MRKLIGSIVVFIMLVSNVTAQIKPTKTYVESNPEPNMTEEYVALKLYKTIDPELTEDIFLPEPFSITVDKEGNLYIFDRGIKTIVKLDKDLKFVRAFGGEGQGPGEFLAGKTVVYINIGMDNKLYCNDTAARKIIVFDVNGRYLGDYATPGILFGHPTVDKEGRIYFFTGDDKQIIANNQNGERIFSFAVNPKEVYSFLFQKQNLPRGELDYFFLTSFVDPDNLLVYFSNSSTMLRISKQKIEAKCRILPKDILSGYKKYINKMLEEEEKNMMALFIRIVPDGDVRGNYYLPFVSDFDNNRGLLYQMNEHGALLKTYCIDYKKTPKMVVIQAKKNGVFYGRITNEGRVGIFRTNGGM